MVDYPDSRSRLLDAAIDVVRERGYAGTRIDDVCARAGLTKGSFFHHFSGKEDLAFAAAAHWRQNAAAAFASAPYHAPSDPLDRLLGYVDFRKALLQGLSIPEFTCFSGTMIQEVHETHPDLRAACAADLEAHLVPLEREIAAAIALYGIAPGWTARSLALHTHAVVQGAFVMAKATQDRQAAAQAFDHLGNYLRLLFGRPPLEKETAQ